MAERRKICKPVKDAAGFLWFSILERVIARINLIWLILLVVWSIVAILLVLDHIYLEFNKTAPSIIEWFPNFILSRLGTDVTKLKSSGNYSIVVSDMIAICAFAFAVFPLIQILVFKVRLKRELREAHGLQIFKVRNEGVDDLRKMLEFYKGAEHITVFCGDFDWLQPDNLHQKEKYKNSSQRQKTKMREMAVKMRDFVKGYAELKKITLVSAKSKELVKTALDPTNTNGLFNHLAGRFVFGAKVGIKCSLIEKVNDKYTFLYRSYSGDKRHLFNANIFDKGEESEELISILRSLIEFGDWKGKVGQANQEGTANTRAY